MHICIKCFVQHHIKKAMAHDHSTAEDVRVRIPEVFSENATMDKEPAFLSRTQSWGEVPGVPASQPEPLAPSTLTEEDLTTLDKEDLNSTYSTLAEIQESANARAPFSHLYDGLAEKTRRHGQDVLLEALMRKSSS